MRWVLALVLIVSAGGLDAQDSASSKPSVTFRMVDIFADPQGSPLAAYQVDFSITGGSAKIAGIEGGAHPAFSIPPFYDPQALQSNRIVLAAFNTASSDKLPAAKTRVATLHLRVVGDEALHFSIKAVTAGTVDGRKMNVLVTFQERKPK